MRLLKLFACTLFAILATGCGTPWNPVALHKGREIFSPASRLGVYVHPLPQPNVYEVDKERGGGANLGLIQVGIIAAATSKLTTHAKTLETKDFLAVRDDLLSSLKSRGMTAEPVLQALKLDDLQSAPTKDPAMMNRDYRPLRQQLGVDRLLVVRVNRIGFNYPFSGIIPIPTGDPMAEVFGTAYLVDLQTNALQWYRPVNVLRGVGKAWDEPPHYRSLTGKYFEALETARDEIVTDLFR